MNKQEYLSALRGYLAPMPAREREELLQDYESHFVFGQDNGRSEAETARMLGDPIVVAQEILGPNFQLLPARPPKKDIARMIGVSIALIFLNMVALPVLVSLWAAFVSVCAAATSGCLSPVILLIEQLLYGDITTAKLFVAIGSTGVGLLLAFAIRYYLAGWIIKFTLWYARWTARTWVGRT